MNKFEIKGGKLYKTFEEACNACMMTDAECEVYDRATRSVLAYWDGEHWAAVPYRADEGGWQ